MAFQHTLHIVEHFTHLDSIVARCLQELAEVFVLGLLVVLLLAPERDRLAVVDQNVEERIHQ